MATKFITPDNAEESGDFSAIDPNTTLDVFVGPNKTVTELANTVDSMDGVRAETIDITNEQDGTYLEVISLEEPVPDEPEKHAVDNFVTVNGVGPEVAKLLLNAGIRTFKQLANTPVTRIREILEAAGTRFRIHEAENWPEQAEQLAINQSLNQPDVMRHPYAFTPWPNEKSGGEATA